MSRLGAAAAAAAPDNRASRELVTALVAVAAAILYIKITKLQRVMRFQSLLVAVVMDGIIIIIWKLMMDINPP